MRKERNRRRSRNRGSQQRRLGRAGKVDYARPAVGVFWTENSLVHLVAPLFCPARDRLLRGLQRRMLKLLEYETGWCHVSEQNGYQPYA